MQNNARILICGNCSVAFEDLIPRNENLARVIACKPHIHTTQDRICLNEFVVRLLNLVWMCQIDIICMRYSMGYITAVERTVFNRIHFR